MFLMCSFVTSNSLERFFFNIKAKLNLLTAHVIFISKKYNSFGFIAIFRKNLTTFHDRSLLDVEIL